MILWDDSLEPERKWPDECVRLTSQDFLAGGTDQQNVRRFADGRTQVHVWFAVARRHEVIRLHKGRDANRQAPTVQDDGNSTNDMLMARFVGPNPARRYAD